MTFKPVFLAAVVAANGALAQDNVSAGDPQSVIDALNALGHSARSEPFDSGRPSVRVEIDGWPSYIDFFGCLDDMTECRNLVFTASFKPRIEVDCDMLNAWNYGKLFTRASFDDNEMPVLEMPVILAEDIDNANFVRVVTLWQGELGRFAGEMGLVEDG